MDSQLKELIYDIKAIDKFSGNHTVQICPTKNSKVDSVTRYIKEGLINKEAIFIIFEPELRRILKLKMNGVIFDGRLFQDRNQIRFFDAVFLLLYLKSGDKVGETEF